MRQWVMKKEAVLRRRISIVWICSFSVSRLFPPLCTRFDAANNGQKSLIWANFSAHTKDSIRWKTTRKPSFLGHRILWRLLGRVCTPSGVADLLRWGVLFLVVRSNIYLFKTSRNKPFHLIYSLLNEFYRRVGGALFHRELWRVKVWSLRFLSLLRESWR